MATVNFDPVYGSGSSGSIIPSLLKAGLSGVAGGFLQQPTNTNTSGNQNSNYSNTYSTTSARTLLPGQADLLGPASSLIMQRLKDPMSAVAPFRAASRDAVTNNYAGLADTLRKKFLATGGGDSGKYGNAVLQGELARLGDLSNVDTAYDEKAMDSQADYLKLAQSLLGIDFGSTISGGQSGTSAGNNTSTSAANQGDPLKTGLGTGLSTLASLLPLLFV